MVRFGAGRSAGRAGPGGRASVGPAAGRLRHQTSPPPAGHPQLASRQGPVLWNGSRHQQAGLRMRASEKSPGPPASQAEKATVVARRTFDFLWPFAALYAANMQVPVGDVEVKKSDAEWKQIISPDAYYVLRNRGTERAGSSPLDKTYDHGVYSCAGCNSPLFLSGSKFDSGTGWPSFYDPLPGAVDLTLQLLYCIGDFGAREVRCHKCGGHLGHVFSDGPLPTGKRYCMNGVALAFEKSEAVEDEK